MIGSCADLSRHARLCWFNDSSSCNVKSRPVSQGEPSHHSLYHHRPGCLVAWALRIMSHTNGRTICVIRLLICGLVFGFKQTKLSLKTRMVKWSYHIAWDILGLIDVWDCVDSTYCSRCCFLSNDTVRRSVLWLSKAWLTYFTYICIHIDPDK